MLPALCTFFVVFANVKLVTKRVALIFKDL